MALVVMFGVATPAAAAPVRSNDASTQADAKTYPWNLSFRPITLGNIVGNQHVLDGCVDVYGHVYVHRNGKTWKFFDHDARNPVEACEPPVDINQQARAYVPLDKGAPEELTDEFSVFGQPPWVIDVDLKASGETMLKGTRELRPQGSPYHTTGIMSSKFPNGDFRASVEWDYDGFKRDKPDCSTFSSGNGGLIAGITGLVTKIEIDVLGCNK
ncbi:hypothetical protein [Labedaea rhizosphaerae]|uniref:hypothetical protein n=1 Tax=Labedaea rhizosphaerae TaxID=598644 RepID=UPI00105FC2BD|nr:hypothetical protein [Labedaea rhizosphaerae]